MSKETICSQRTFLQTWLARRKSHFYKPQEHCRCDMTDSHVVYDPSPCLIWLIHFQGSPWYDFFIWVTWIIYNCDITDSSSSTRHFRQMIHSHVRHDLFIFVTWLSHNPVTASVQHGISLSHLLSLSPSLPLLSDSMHANSRYFPKYLSYKLAFPNLIKSVIEKKELELHILFRCLSLAVPHYSTRRPPPPLHNALIAAKTCA